MRTRTASVLLATGLALAGCEAEDPEGEGANVVEDDTATEQANTEEPEEPEATTEATEAEEEAAQGTRDNPVEVGTTVDLGDWQVTVTDVTKDATEQVMSENQFNEEPAEGRQFVMWHVEGTYVGEDSGEMWIDLSWALVGSEGNTFGTSMDDYCGTIPNPIDEAGETFPDGSVEGNVCVSAPSGQIEGGTIRVENSLSMDPDRVFYGIP